MRMRGPASAHAGGVDRQIDPRIAPSERCCCRVFGNIGNLLVVGIGRYIRTVHCMLKTIACIEHKLLPRCKRKCLLRGELHTT